MKTEIALVVMSDHAFIPSFAHYNESAKENREKYIREVLDSTVDFLVDCGAEVTLREWVYDVDSARAVGSKLREIDFDLLVLTVPIWPGGDSVLELAKTIKNVPLVLWTPVNPVGDLCGYFEATSDLKSVAVNFESVFGKAEEAKEQIRQIAKAAVVAKKLRLSRIGQMGYTPQAFLDVTASELDLRARFGLEVAHIDISEIYAEMTKITPHETQELASEFKKKIGEMKIPEKDLLVPTKICGALDRIIKRYKLDGYALSCSPMNFEIAHPCLAVSKSTEEGVVASCEGDLPSAVMLLILREMTGKPPAVLDVDSGDIDRNVLNLWHCGHLATSLAENSADIAITPPLYEGEVMGPGAVLFFPMRSGRVTITNLSGKGDKMFITSGESLKTDKNKGSGAYSEIKLDSKLTHVLRVMAESGVSHHLCIVHGHVRPELEALCKMLKIQAIVC